MRIWVKPGHEYHFLYKTARWLKRRKQQLTHQPLCEICLADKIVKAATVAHHLVDHRGDVKLFYSSPLQSLCKECHDCIEYAASRGRGCDVYGRPHRRTPIYIDHNAKRKAASR